MRSVQEIDQELETLRGRLASVQGTETEIYTRIVGYYRSLKNWNKGKREEYDHRRTFEADAQVRRDEVPGRSVPRDGGAAVGEPAVGEPLVLVGEPAVEVRKTQGGRSPSSPESSSAFATALAATTVETPPAGGNGMVTYQYFYRNGCSGCGPVRQKLAATGIPGIAYDVDTDEGFAMAAAKEIMATPTVILYAPDGSTLGRASAVQEIDAILEQ